MGVFDQIWLSHVLPPNKSPPATEYVTSSQATPPNCSGSLPGVKVVITRLDSWYVCIHVNEAIICISANKLPVNVKKRAFMCRIAYVDSSVYHVDAPTWSHPVCYTVPWPDCPTFNDATKVMTYSSPSDEGTPTKCPYIEGVPSSEGHFNDKRQIGAPKWPKTSIFTSREVSPRRRDYCTAIWCSLWTVTYRGHSD